MKDLLGREGILWTEEMRTSCAFFLLQTSNLRSFYLLNKFCEFVWKIIELNLIKRFLNRRKRNKNKSSLHVYIILRKIFDSTIFSKEKEDRKGEKKKRFRHTVLSIGRCRLHARRENLKIVDSDRAAEEMETGRQERFGWKKRKIYYIFTGIIHTSKSEKKRKKRKTIDLREMDRGKEILRSI